ncbi:MAG: lysophospholipid acyltransferase family protein [Candidatus Kapaibacterium sp.]
MPIIRLILVALVTVYFTIKELWMLTFSSRIDTRMYVGWSRALNKIIGIEIEIEGIENIKANQSYIFVCNHSSLLDIPVLLGTLPGDVRIIYKRELEKIPIFGYGLKRSNLISIDRSDPRKAMKSLDEAIDKIQAGASVIIFPEGTRDSGSEVGEFKRGGFLIAEKALTPIIPIAVSGTYDLLPAGKLILKPGKVRISIMPKIDVKAMDRSELKGLKENVRNKIVEELAKISK